MYCKGHFVQHLRLDILWDLAEARFTRTQMHVVMFQFYADYFI